MISGHQITKSRLETLENAISFLSTPSEDLYNIAKSGKFQLLKEGLSKEIHPDSEKIRQLIITLYEAQLQVNEFMQSL